jgi:hypothetical protein
MGRSNSRIPIRDLIKAITRGSVTQENRGRTAIRGQIPLDVEKARIYQLHNDGFTRPIQ